MKKTVLEVKNLFKSYDGKRNVLENISLEFKEGELVSVIGSSGAGKSTFLRCLNKMIIPSSGDILFNDESLMKAGKKDIKKIRAKIGMIFQHYNIVKQLTTIENVLHGKLGQMSSLKGLLGLYTESDKKEAFELLKELGLKGHEYKKCGNLSGGQKQRVGIARALIQNPNLILCDEPIASLDPQSAKVIMDILKDITEKKGITCIANLHQVDVAMKYSDRVIGLKNGKILFNGPPSKLTKEIIHEIYGAKNGELIVDETDSLDTSNKVVA
ncbi:MAG: phosphonate ABC transporter ATP-binding protein [Cetobacterium sp.]|uniref:phosphonate ABC transporter ATP-binding protein n=1 Tax=Cetobacterium sp. TaxID=2071632 RepID=UPI003F2D619E